MPCNEVNRHLDIKYTQYHDTHMLIRRHTHTRTLDTHIDRQADEQTDGRTTYRQTDRQTDEQQTDRQTDAHTHRTISESHLPQLK